MPTIKVCLIPNTRPRSAEIQANLGDSICEALLDNGIEIEHACEMSRACTTCHCIVHQGFGLAARSEEEEEDLLDRLGPGAAIAPVVPGHREQGRFDVEIPRYSINPHRGKPLMSRQIDPRHRDHRPVGRGGDRIIEIGWSNWWHASSPATTCTSSTPSLMATKTRSRWCTASAAVSARQAQVRRGGRGHPALRRWRQEIIIHNAAFDVGFLDKNWKRRQAGIRSFVGG